MRHVIDRLDHQMINEVEPFIKLNPSAENLAKYFYDETNGRLTKVTEGRVRVKDVTVFETDNTTAKYGEWAPGDETNPPLWCNTGEDPRRSMVRNRQCR